MGDRRVVLADFYLCEGDVMDKNLHKLYPTKNPLMPLYLSGGVVASALACAISTELPPIPKVALAVTGLAGGLGVMGKTLILEKQTPELERNEVLLEYCHQKSVQCAAGYYNRYVKAADQGMPIPDGWYEQYALHGGRPPRALPPAGTPAVSLSPDNTAVEIAAAMTNQQYVTEELAQMPELHHDLEALTGEAPIDTDWVTSLLKYPYVLIYGAPGSGKTTFVQWLINQRIALGHSVFALDPHYEAGSWQFCEVKGAGLNYTEIDEFIARLTDLVKRRYMQRQHQRGLVFEPITVICEELTEWADNCENVKQLINKIPDYRKVGVHLLLVAHGRSLPSLGGAKGKRDMLDSALAELKLLVKTGKHGEPIPLMKGLLKLPHKKPQEVRIPNIYTPEPEPANQQVEPVLTQSGQGVHELDEPPEPVCEPQETTIEPAYIAQSSELELEPEPEIIITPLERSQFVKLKEKGMNKAQIVDFIWDCKKGKSRRYEEASLKYNQLLADFESSQAA